VNTLNDYNVHLNLVMSAERSLLVSGHLFCGKPAIMLMNDDDPCRCAIFPLHSQPRKVLSFFNRHYKCQDGNINKVCRSRLATKAAFFTSAQIRFYAVGFSENESSTFALKIINNDVSNNMEIKETQN
jgi:hypothetical protein